MNPRSTGILLVVASLLGAFIYFYEIRGEDAREQAEEIERRIFADIEADAVSELELTTSDGKDARIQRVDGRWQMLEPLAFPADASTVDSMASTLASLTSERVIEEPEAFEVYGLGEDARVVHFRAGDRALVLRIGSSAPVGSMTYAAVDGASGVYLMPTWRVNSLTKSLDDLRERRVLQFDTAAIDRIDARWPGGGVVLERQEPGWVLTEPPHGAADAAVVENLLSDLAFLRADGFVDDPPADSESGLAEPELSVELRAAATEESPERVVTFAIGQVLDGRKRLARGGQLSLYEIGEERLADFPRSVVAYRFKDLANFPASDAQSFELVFFDDSGGTSDERVVRGERSDAGWETSPVQLGSGKARGLVSELSRLTAIDIVADSLDASELANVGLAPPRVTIRVFGASGEESEPPPLAEVQLGESDLETGIVAKAASRPAVYRLDYELAEHLPLTWEAFQNRFTEPAAPPADAAPELEEFPLEPDAFE